jgi:hypothetical protein
VVDSSRLSLPACVGRRLARLPIESTRSLTIPVEPTSLTPPPHTHTYSGPHGSQGSPLASAPAAARRPITSCSCRATAWLQDLGRQSEWSRGLVPQLLAATVRGAAATSQSSWPVTASSRRKTCRSKTKRTQRGGLQKRARWSSSGALCALYSCCEPLGRSWPRRIIRRRFLLGKMAACTLVAAALMLKIGAAG